MSITQAEISKTFNLMNQRSDAPKLTPEQLNAIGLLILGKTDKEVSEAIGVRRETVTRWHKKAFFYRGVERQKKGAVGRIEALAKGHNANLKDHQFEAVY